MGYGVSGGAAGGMSLRGIGGSPTAGLLVLIDGHPQYMGLMGHPIADAYQSMMAEKVEVLRGPASVLYGSNAMGGVINIVTRKQQEDGVNTNMQVGYGSYNTLQTEFSNRVKKGRFSSVVTGSYNRTDGHRPDMKFEQYGGYAKLGYDINSFWKVWGLSLIHILLAYFAERMDSYAFYEVDVWMKSLSTLIIAVVTLIVLFILAWRNGRTYCNTICPVGTVLGFISKYAIFKPVIDTSKCNSCGLCARNCKASCINSKAHEIDYSRCVACMDCIGKCKHGAIKYTRRKPKNETATSAVSYTHLTHAHHRIYHLCGHIDSCQCQYTA